VFFLIGQIDNSWSIKIGMEYNEFKFVVINTYLSTFYNLNKLSNYNKL